MDAPEPPNRSSSTPKMLSIFSEFYLAYFQILRRRYFRNLPPTLLITQHGTTQVPYGLRCTTWGVGGSR